MQVKTDLVDSHEVSNTADGITVRRNIEITGLTGTPSDMIYKAMQDPRIPNRGSLHPTIPGMMASEVYVSTTGPFAARVQVLYVSFAILSKFRHDEPDRDPEGQVSYNFGTVGDQTQFNNQGQQLSVTHTYEKVDSEGNRIRTTETQGVSVDLEVPVGGFDIVREERAFPRALADEHRGTVNRSKIWGYDKRTLLCVGITGYSNPGRGSYTVTYSFEINAKTYDAVIAFIDPATGAPASNLIKGEGLKTERIYNETEFSRMKLTVPGT